MPEIQENNPLLEELIKPENEELTAREITDNIIEETTEEVDVSQLAEQEIVEETAQWETQEEASAVPEVISETVKRKIQPGLILNVAALVTAVFALIFSVFKTDLKIGQGELYVESGVVNEMLGNLIRNDLAARIPMHINLQWIDIQVVLYGSDSGKAERYSGVSGISQSDSVSAEIMFFPQNNVDNFVKDCRLVLDAMSAQEVVYDKISFTAKDAKTEIHADLSGRFSMDISAKDLESITFYYGEIEPPRESDNIKDITDIEDIFPDTQNTE